MGINWAIPRSVFLVMGETSDDALITHLITESEVSAIIHFGASIVVPDSVSDPLSYYRNNTVNSRALIECAVSGAVKHFIFSSTAALTAIPAHRQPTKGATHLIKVAVQAALGKRAEMEAFGADFPTPDGTCIRDYIHVADLARAHADALSCLRACGRTATLKCGYGHGLSALEVIDAVKHVSGADFRVDRTGCRPGDTARLVAQCDRAHELPGWKPQFDDLATIVTPHPRTEAQAKHSA